MKCWCHVCNKVYQPKKIWHGGLTVKDENGIEMLVMHCHDRSGKPLHPIGEIRRSLLDKYADLTGYWKGLEPHCHKPPNMPGAR